MTFFYSVHIHLYILNVHKDIWAQNFNFLRTPRLLYIPSIVVFAKLDIDTNSVLEFVEEVQVLLLTTVNITDLSKPLH